MASSSSGGGLVSGGGVHLPTVDEAYTDAIKLVDTSADRKQNQSAQYLTLRRDLGLKYNILAESSPEYKIFEDGLRRVYSERRPPGKSCSSFRHDKIQQLLKVSTPFLRTVDL